MSSDGGCGRIAGSNRGGRLCSDGGVGGPPSCGNEGGGGMRMKCGLCFYGRSAAKIGRVNCDDGGGGREICGGGGVVGGIPS